MFTAIFGVDIFKIPVIYKKYLIIPGTNVSIAVSAAPLPGSSQFDGRRNFLLSGHRLKKLWERFVTAMNSVGLSSKIVVKNHSHQARTFNLKVTIEQTNFYTRSEVVIRVQ